MAVGPSPGAPTRAWVSGVLPLPSGRVPGHGPLAASAGGAARDGQKMRDSGGIQCGLRANRRRVGFFACRGSEKRRLFRRLG